MDITTMKLEELCTIKTGAPTSRAKKIAEGIEPREVKVLLPRAMQGGAIIDEELAIETVGEVKEENFTREGDVVIKLSTPYDSVYIDKAHEGIMITSFGMVLRKKDDAELDMRFLSLFLNLPQTNSILQAVSTGQSVAMAMLKRQTVADIEVSLLPLERQEKLASLFQVVRERKNQYERLIELDNELVTSQMIKSIWGEEN
ncbi:restriction endonuclease subunit S [Adlercreutzia sp. CNCM I-6216]